MSSLVVHNARVVTPGGILDRSTVRVRDGRIVAVSRDGQLAPTGGAPSPADQTIDAKGLYLAPGFIDIHVHGGGGVDYVDGTVEAFDVASRFYASRGVTALQPTTSAMPIQQTIRVLELTRRCKDKRTCPGSALLGVHLEGPFLNAGQAGAQPPEYILRPTPELVDQLLAYDDVITEVTLAPEIPGALDFVSELRQRNILVAAGHSQARENEVQAAIAAGLGHTSHIYSSMSTVVRDGPWRIPGLLEATLVYDELTTEMIADVRHLPPTLMRLVYKCKGPDRLCLVSDAMSGAGLPEGREFSFAGKRVLVQDGVAMLPNGTAFAGSITPLDAMLRNAIDVLGLSLEEGLRLVTLNPARFLKIDDRKGTIEPGKDADLVLFDDQISIRTTIIGGKVVYSA
jgi:N-acetylglucosamine-6-phosphate deacetylase